MSLRDKPLQLHEPGASQAVALERRNPIVVSETELIPQSSLDFELERVLNKLEILHRSLQSARALPESTVVPQTSNPNPGYLRSADSRRASVALFSSHVRTRERREFVIGLSFILSSPFGFLRSGSGRNWKVLLGCMVTILAGFFLAAHHLSDTGGTPRIHPEEPPVRAVAQNTMPAEPVRQAKEQTQAAPAPGNERRVSKKPVQPIKPPAMPPDSVPPDPVVPNTESLKAIQKLTSQAQSLLEPEPESIEPESHPPVPTVRVIPAYPEEARLRNIGGEVEMQVSVDEQGNVTEAQPVSGPPELYAAAMDAMLRWRFKPATENGVKSRGQTTATIVFSRK